MFGKEMIEAISRAKKDLFEAVGAPEYVFLPYAGERGNRQGVYIFRSIRVRRRGKTFCYVKACAPIYYGLIDEP